jgi:flagellin
VNHNIQALNSHRALQASHAGLAKNLEKLSSGVKINRASEGPAAFMISEHMRSQIVGLNQAIDNSETAVSMIQTTDANMSEVGTLLNRMRQLAIHAANEGVNDMAALQTDQAEVDNILGTIDAIAKQAQFGNRKLLDGSMETTGTTTGNGLEFINATLATGDSREHGFDVKLTQLATRSEISGTAALTDEIIKDGETLTVIEKGKMATYTTNRDDTADTTIKNLQAEVNRQGLNVDVIIDAGGNINVTHREYGSDHRFQVSSSTAGVLSKDAGDVTVAEIGVDIKGTINGESCTGKGQVLTGAINSKCVDGLSVRFYGDGERGYLPPVCKTEDLVNEDGVQQPPERVTNENMPDGGFSAGRVYVTQNGTKFHIGGNKYQTVGLSIKNINPEYLAMDVTNRSGFKNLSEVDLTTFQGAQDSISLIDRAIDQVLENRGELGAFQKNTLESNLSNIRIANENLVSSESIIRDTDMAKEMAAFTRNQIMSQSSNAMLAQANQIPENVLQLIS